MLVNNDKAGRWVNGTIGMVSGIKKPRGEDDLVLVTPPDGALVEVSPCTWEIFEYQYDKATKRISARKTGDLYPVSDPPCLGGHYPQEPGQDIRQGRHRHRPRRVCPWPGLRGAQPLHGLAGITLIQKITKAHIRADWRVAHFLTRFQYKKADERMGIDEKRRVIEDAMRRGLNLEILYLRPDDTKPAAPYVRSP